LTDKLEKFHNKIGMYPPNVHSRL